MLERLEMHDIQDKTRLLDEMNETRDAVNKLEATLNGHRRSHGVSSKPIKQHKPKGFKANDQRPISKPKTGPVKSS